VLMLEQSRSQPFRLRDRLVRGVVCHLVP
jgi:hypothetical protein